MILQVAFCPPNPCPNYFPTTDQRMLLLLPPPSLVLGTFHRARSCHYTGALPIFLGQDTVKLERQLGWAAGESVNMCAAAAELPSVFLGGVSAASVLPLSLEN